MWLTDTHTYIYTYILRDTKLPERSHTVASEVLVCFFLGHSVTQSQKAKAKRKHIHILTHTHIHTYTY